MRRRNVNPRHEKTDIFKPSGKEGRPILRLSLIAFLLVAAGLGMMLWDDGPGAKAQSIVAPVRQNR